MARGALCGFLCATLLVLALAAEPKATKTAKAAPTEEPKKATTTASKPSSPPASSSEANMEVIDYIRTAALVVAYLAAFCAGREKWLLVSTIAGAAGGCAMYFFPKTLIDYQTDGDLDVLHLYLAQQTGAIVIAMAVASYYSSQSRNPAVANSLMLTRTLGGMAVVVTAGMDYLKTAGEKQKLNGNFLTFGLLSMSLLTLGNLIYTFRSGAFGGGAVSLRNRVSVHTFIDVFFCLPYGMMSYGYPEYSLENVRGVTLDGIHAHAIRGIGALMVTSALSGLCSLSFTDDKDKRIYLLSRLTTAIFSMPVFMLYQWKYAFVTANFFYFSLVLFSIFTINMLMGYYHPISLPKFLKRD